MIQPGLERISLLVKNIPFRWKAIHVAGTNGKGSICALTSKFLLRRKVWVGHFTSPHLIDRWDCIHINGSPVAERFFKRVEERVLEDNHRHGINATEFELLTATAFRIFHEAKVAVGVVEVGMGGKLDATNVLNNQIVSVISKIARDHEAFLGNSIEEIARHKAGILRPGVPYIVNPTNEWNVHEVIKEVANEIGAGPAINVDRTEMRQTKASTLWKRATKDMMPFQLDNVTLAYLAASEAAHNHLKFQRKWKFSQVASALSDRSLPGRLQMSTIRYLYGPDKQILVDGAHNEDSAKVLGEYVQKNLRHTKPKDTDTVLPKGGGPVTWVIAMSDTKNPRSVLTPLLQPHDHIITTAFGPVDSMPWVKSMDPAKILEIAKEIHPDITGLAMTRSGVHRALIAAKALTHLAHPVVLAGSLYLVGEFMRERRNSFHLDLVKMEQEERRRVGSMFPQTDHSASPTIPPNPTQPQEESKSDIGTSQATTESWRTNFFQTEKPREQIIWRKSPYDATPFWARGPEVDELSVPVARSLLTEVDEINKDLQDLKLLWKK